MYISFNPRVPRACQIALSKLELCINELSNWMTVNKLKLNHNKTEFFIAGTTQGLAKLPPVELKVGNDMIKPSSSVRNLGIIFDNHMSMTQHINSLISSDKPLVHYLKWSSFVFSVQIYSRMHADLSLA